ncbi:MAG: GAF domain-containing protein [Bacillota bacterium]
MPYIKKIETNDTDELYNYIEKQLDNLIKDENDFISNLANFSSLLGLLLKDINWAGFYLLKNNKLKLGPFYGQPAVSTIEIGNGVCGTAIKENQNQIVKNVCKFPGHISCDIRSKSEIVILLKNNNKTLGVLDIDSPLLDRFSKKDEKYLEKMLNKLLDVSEI